MAASSSKSSSSSKVPSVEYRHNVALGKHEIGARIDGQFVPFAQLDDPVVAQRVENAKDVAGDTSDTEDEEEAE